MRIIPRSSAIVSLVLVAAVPIACAVLPEQFRPKRTCRPAHQHAIHPGSEKDHEFPTYFADVLHRPRTLGFQVCDSAVGDLNEDGQPEILVADHISSGFGYFKNDPAWVGSRIFEDGVRVPLQGNNNSAGVVVGDFNSDGRLDVANSNHPGTVTVSINPTAEDADNLEFPRSSELLIDLGIGAGDDYGLAGREGGLTVADFNGDELPDIATADLGQTAEEIIGRKGWCPAGDPTPSRHGTTILINTTEPGAPKASFAPKVHFPTVGPAISIDSADFNFDGKIDLVTADTGDSSLSVIVNQTEQAPDALPCFLAPQQLDIPKEGLERQGAGPTNPVATDLNGDGNPDLASANWNARTITFWINLTDESEKGSQPRFSKATVVSTGKLPPLVLHSADLDNDGLNDIVVIPLSTHSKAAMMVLRNKTERGGDTAVFEIDAVYPIPKKLENGWLYTYFSSAGEVHDFDGDGTKDIAVVIAKGSLLLKTMQTGNDILKYVDPGVPLWVVHPVLPHDSMLVIYRHQDSASVPSDVPICEEPPPLEEDADQCETVRHVLASLESEVVGIGSAGAASGHSDLTIQSNQANHSADRLREIVDDVPPELRADLELVVQHVDDAGEQVMDEPSWHVDHDVDDAIDRVTAYLHEECGD